MVGGGVGPGGAASTGSSASFEATLSISMFSFHIWTARKSLTAFCSRRNRVSVGKTGANLYPELRTRLRHVTSSRIRTYLVESFRPAVFRPMGKCPSTQENGVFGGESHKKGYIVSIIVIVGLSDAAVKETRDPARTALANSGFKIPWAAPRSISR